MKSIIQYLAKRKYESYLLSLVILLFGQILLPSNHEPVWQHMLVIQNVMIGLLLFKNSSRSLYLFVLALSIILTSECLLLFWFDNTLIQFTMGLSFSIYFFLASLKVYKDILIAEEVGDQMIAAVFSGFIMLGFIGTFIFVLIEIIHPTSFSNLGVNEETFQNLNYFSFVSLLTIGYGDIIPLTQVAKKAVIFLGLMGNFYLTFITAVIIGKYLNQKKDSRKKQDKDNSVS
jgi:voltage-gated potassium channel